jgi:hypothetical protein
MKWQIRSVFRKAWSDYYHWNFSKLLEFNFGGEQWYFAVWATTKKHQQALGYKVSVLFEALKGLHCGESKISGAFFSFFNYCNQKSFCYTYLANQRKMTNYNNLILSKYMDGFFIREKGYQHNHQAHCIIFIYFNLFLTYILICKEYIQ